MDKYFELALQEAQKSPMSSKYGAIIVYNNMVISKAYNTYKKHSSIQNQCLLCG
jgi:hypothetical protein